MSVKDEDLKSYIRGSARIKVLSNMWHAGCEKRESE